MSSSPQLRVGDEAFIWDSATQKRLRVKKIVNLKKFTAKKDMFYAFSVIDSKRGVLIAVCDADGEGIIFVLEAKDLYEGNADFEGNMASYGIAPKDEIEFFLELRKLTQDKT